MDLRVLRALRPLQVVKGVFRLAVRELFSRGAFQLGEVGRRSRRPADLRAHGPGELDEVGAVEIRHDVERRARDERDLETLARGAGVPCDEIRPAALKGELGLPVRGGGGVRRAGVFFARLLKAARVECAFRLGFRFLRVGRGIRRRRQRRGSERDGQAHYETEGPWDAASAHNDPSECSVGAGGVHVFFSPSGIETSSVWGFHPARERVTLCDPDGRETLSVPDRMPWNFESIKTVAPDQAGASITSAPIGNR